MEHLINIIKEVEIDIRSTNNLSKDTLIKLSEINSWDYQIVQDAILRIRMAVQNNDLNFVYKMYTNKLKDYSFYKDQNYKPVDLIIACLRRDQNDLALTDAGNRLYVPNNIKHDVFEIWGLQVTEARNLAVKEALKRNARYLLFIDDDIIAPNNALIKLFKLLEDNKDTCICAGEYYKKIEPLDSAHVYTDPKNISNNIIREVDLCAMGFTLIDLEQVLSKVPMPLFWEFGAPDGYWLMGEDAFFTKNCEEYLSNKKALVDTSIKLLHYDKLWHRCYGERDKEVTYATNNIDSLATFERLRVPKEYPKVSIAIPTRDANSPIGCNLQKLHCLRGYQTEFITVNGLPVDQARNNLVQQALDNDSKYLLFIDDDVVPPIDGFIKLLEHIEKDEVDIVSGDYLLKGNPPHSIHLHLDDKGMVNELERVKFDDTLVKSNWLIGLGFVLIDMDLFKQAQQPWFMCHSKNPNRELDDGGVNEDAHFSELSFINGFNIYIDKAIKCLHLDFKNQQVYSFDEEYDINEYAGFDRQQ